MPSHMPPVPPANRRKDNYRNDSGKKVAKAANDMLVKKVSNAKLVNHEHHPNAAEKGETGNIKQNTTNKGYFHGRRFD